MNVKELLEKEIEEILNTMDDLAVNSAEYKDASDRLVKLIEKRNEMVKIEYDHQDRKQSRMEENDLKAKQMEDEKKDRRVKNVISIVNTAVKVVVPVWATLICLNFEMTNSVTTIPGREFIKQLLLPKNN